MVTFGSTAAEFESNRGDISDDVWIKNFREGATFIRILQPTTTWWRYKEHYDEGVGYFTCTGNRNTCVGCTDGNEKVRQTSNRYAFNALDEQGRLNVFKAGARLYRSFLGKEQRMGTILDRDWTIVRTGGKFNEIQYEAEPGDKHDIPVDELADRLVDLGALVTDKAYQAAESYGKPLDGVRPGTRYLVKVNGEWVDEDATGDGDGYAPEATGAEATSHLAAVPEQAAEPDPAPAQPAAGGGTPDFGGMTTTELKAWLSEKKIEYPDRAPRSRLVALAEDYIPY